MMTIRFKVKPIIWFEHGLWRCATTKDNHRFFAESPRMAWNRWALFQIEFNAWLKNIV